LFDITIQQSQAMDTMMWNGNPKTEKLSKSSFNSRNDVRVAQYAERQKITLTGVNYK